MGLVDQIKNDVKKSGSNKGKFIYFREGKKVRLRFLQDMDDGIQITFHDNFERGIQVPCQELFGRNCPYCDEEDIRTRSQYIWSVWNYEQNEVQLFMFPVNNCSPIPPLMAMYENYGTLTDRDYVVSVQGKQQNKSFTVVPMDKNKFRNTKAKPYSENAVLKMLDKAWPYDGDEEERPRKKPKSSKGAKKEAAKKEAEDWGEKLPDKDELEEMSPQKLYNLCRERDIDVAPKKKASYYIEMLEDWREENEEPDDDSEDDYDGDWGDDEEDDDVPDYSEMTAKELYKLCKERDIEAAPKKPEKYYVRLLEEADQAEDDWGDSGEDDDWEDE